MTTAQSHTREALATFATAEAGSDYFETDAHYRALADRILGSVHDDRPFIVVIGDPPPSPHSLSASLDEAVARQQPVMVLACGPLLRGDALLDVCRGLAAHTQANDAQPGALPFPLFIFDDADQLADEQIRDIYKTSQSINHWIVVMLGRPDFLARLEQPEIRFAREELTTCLNFQELGPVEIRPYLQHQLGTAEAGRIFTDDVVADLRARSAGDPRIVNRLAHELLHNAGATADDPGSAAAAPAEEPPPEALDQPAVAEPAATPLEASLAEPDASTAAEVPPAADDDTLLNRLERRLLGTAAETAPPPASPLPSEEPIGEARDEPPPLAAPEAALEEPDGAIGAGTATEVSPPAEEAAQAVPLEPATPAPSPPKRRAPWPEIVAVFCLAGVVVAGGLFLHLQEDRGAPAKPGVETTAAPTRPPAPSAAPEAARPAPPPAAEAPRPPPAPTAEPKANAVPAPPPSASAEPPRPAPPPAAEPETTAAPAPSAAQPTPAVPPAAPPPAAPTTPPVAAPQPGPEATPKAPPPAASRPSAAEVAALLARGDELFATGDLASGRLFWERAADAGDAQAALRLGESFDPGFLDQAHVRGAMADPAKARSWYRRARELGSAEAEILLKSVAGN